jgi:DNA adenine methylase
MTAPFPWFGGKRRVASLVWERFGDVPNYVEPFAGSLAVLLARPHEPRTETVNDLDCYLANFWRAVKNAPDAVAGWADWPVNEADILARHEWLLSRDEFRQRLRTDPDFYDPKIAGWWVWGICSWIGSGWCVERGDGRPPEQLPHLGDAGRGERIAAWFADLHKRLRDVRVACGEWDRILGPSVTEKHGITGVFLDPPYSSKLHSLTYSAQTADAGWAVRQWAIANADNPMLRIALCGYEGEHDMPGWTAVRWKAHGGYGSQASGRGRANAERETVWFSPHCLGSVANMLPLEAIA